MDEGHWISSILIGSSEIGNQLIILLWPNIVNERSTAKWLTKWSECFFSTSDPTRNWEQLRFVLCVKIARWWILFLTSVLILFLSCIGIIAQVQILSPIKQAHDSSVVRTNYKLVRFNSRSYIGEIAQRQSALTDDYNNVSGKLTCHIWELIIERDFTKTCCSYEPFHWFIQLRKETFQHSGRFWHLFLPVMWSILVPFYLFSLVLEYLVKKLFYSGLLYIKWL